MDFFDFKNEYGYEWPDIWYSELDTSIGIRALRMLISAQEDSFKIIHEKFREQVDSDATLKSLKDEQEQAHYYSQFFDQEHMAIDQLKRLQRYGLCVSILAFFEARLRTLSKSVEQEFKFKIKANDLADSEDLSRYKRYFEKVFEADLVDCDPFYTPITQQKYVRNIINHQDGVFNEDQKKRIKIVDGLGYRQLGENYEIQILDVIYLHYLLDNVEKYLDRLFHALDKRYRELKR